ncbi:hypothetical protein [Nocardia sp. CNY236]|uniref:hypothetical protein n=1 Tax=Nocardia sp. CNY236 TaxID=1169152 RepID=UPI00041E4041|nr:hypothetical protein [Nocardia sp. CNY236]
MAASHFMETIVSLTLTALVLFLVVAASPGTTRRRRHGTSVGEIQTRIAAERSRAEAKVGRGL